MHGQSCMKLFTYPTVRAVLNKTVIFKVTFRPFRCTSVKTQILHIISLSQPFRLAENGKKGGARDSRILSMADSNQKTRIEEELLEIVSFEFPSTTIQSKSPSQTANKCMKFQQLIPQGFKRILFSPDEVAQVIAACEERLLKTKVIIAPFTVAEIQGGILKQHLIDEDYVAPLMVGLADFP